MTTILTPKLLLNKESDDETIDQYAANWPILDMWAGEMIVADGTTPPDSSLFDGLVVREATSGKSWIAVKNPSTGVFTKTWLSYPWQASAFTSSVAVGTVSPGTYTNYALTTFDTAKAVNSDASALSGGQILPPIVGIYSVYAQARWLESDTSDSSRGACIRFNNNNTRPTWNEDIQHTTSNVCVCVCTDEIKIGAANQPFGINVWQNSGANKNVALTVIVELVTPV